MAIRKILAGALLVGVTALGGKAMAAQDITPRQRVAPSQHVELLTTSARLSGDGRHWIVPLHAWVYTPRNSRARKAGLAAILQRRLGVAASSPSTHANFDRRANLLLADNHRDRRVVVSLAGRQFALPPTHPNGHARTEIALPVGDLQEHAREGRLTVDVVLPAGDPRRLSGTVLLVPAQGLSVISDIDDTVKVSHVTDRARLMASTFVDDFSAVPGMAPLYAGWAKAGAALHFVSSSPWHLYAPLTQMLDAAGFPKATLALKHIRLKDATILDLFRDASKTKPPLIEALLAAYPGRQFVLVGDSGELDPEIYANIHRRHPGRIVQILIRNVTGATPSDDRCRKVFDGLDPALWQLFDAPEDIRWRPK